MANDQMLFFLAERSCFLCRINLPYFAGASPAARQPMTWEMHVLGFIDTSVDPSQGPRVFTFKTDLGDPQFIVNPTLTLPSYSGRVTIAVVHQRPLSKYRPAYFAHQSCCKVVALLQRKLACRELYSLAVQTCELLPKDCWGQERPWHLASLAGTVETGIVDTQSTSLGSWLSKCAKLPTEMQNHILKHIQGTNSLVSSLMTALHTSTASRCRSLASIPSHPRVKSLLPAEYVDIAHVCASFVTLFGRPYLASLEVFHKQGHGDAAHQQCLEIRINAVRKVEFITGMHGISAIRFYFCDGSVSDWLGDARRGWRSRPIEVTRSDIYFPRHGQRAIVDRFAELFARRPETAPLQVLWDATWNPSKHGVPFVAQFFRHQLAERSSCFPGRPMCRYMPLLLDGQYARGITVYTTCFGISCIVVHRDDTHQAVSTPHKRGLPTTFYFRQGERIVTLGLVTTGHTNFQYGPFLMFKTNNNRIAYFGPPSSLSDSTARWVSMIPEQINGECAVMGLIVDQLAMMKGSFKTLGVCCKAIEGTANLDETVASPFGLNVIRLALPKGLRKPPFKTDTVFTRAQLSYIRQLRVLCRGVDARDPNQGLRWCGLWIYHNDGSTETLGLWDDFLTKDARIIYDAETDGPLIRIAFRLRRRMPGEGNPGGQSEYIVNIAAIVASQDDPESTEDTGDIGDPQSEGRSDLLSNGDRVVEFRCCALQPVSPHFHAVTTEETASCAVVLTWYTFSRSSGTSPSRPITLTEILQKLWAIP
ncbi:hypothetical protein V8C26DRAFT_191023 [Trichoderma gracile]